MLCASGLAWLALAGCVAAPPAESRLASSPTAAPSAGNAGAPSSPISAAPPPPAPTPVAESGRADTEASDPIAKPEPVDAGVPEALDGGTAGRRESSLSDAGAPSSQPSAAQLVIERPYLPWARPRTKGEVAAAGQDEAIGRWNLGGTQDPSFRSNRPGFHPGTRVIVNTRVISGKLPKTAPLNRRTGKRVVVLSVTSLLARSRKHGYWPFRLCFERAALAGATPKGGKTMLRIAVSASGKIHGARLVGTKLEDSTIAECVRDRAKEIELLPPPKRIAVQLEVELWPGDVQLPLLPPTPPDAPELDAKALQAALQQHEQQLRGCYAEGLARDASLWGRIQLHTLLEPSGSVRSVRESESRFPDSQVTRCIVGVVEKVKFPRRNSHSSHFEIGLRFGTMRSPLAP